METFTDAAASQEPAAAPMDDSELLKILREEERDATSYYDSEFAQAQASAMARYNGELYGDEVEGRSKVVTHDVEDTINWIMPHLLRTFLSSDELVTVESKAQDQAQPALMQMGGPQMAGPMAQPMPPQMGAGYGSQAADTQCIGEYLTHCFFVDNPGERIIHDFAFDGMLQRVGWLKVSWQDAEAKPPQIIEGMPADQLGKYIEDPEYEILSQSTEDGQTYTIEIRHTPRMGRVSVENVPPEEIAWSRNARSAAEADYIRRKREVYVAEIARLYPDKAEELQSPDRSWNSGADDMETDTDPRRHARFPEESQDYKRPGDHFRRRKTYLIEEDVRIDFDGDGIVELRHIKRMGDVILENEAVERSELVCWSPIRIPHRLAGRSVADTMIDFQRIRTVLTRRALDSLAQSLTQQKVVNTQAVGADDIDGLLDNDIGHVVRAKGDVRAALMPIETPDVSGQALTWLEYTDQKQEQASGATRHNQGIDPKGLTKTASGMDMLQSAGMTRIESYARWLGLALEEVFEHILRLVSAHQDQPRLIKIKGRPVTIDPRLWSDDMRVSVHVGLGGETRERKLFNLNLIKQTQEQILLQAGPGNPLVSLAEYRTTLQRMVETMGFKDASAYFKEIPPDYQPQEPGEDPKMAEAKAKMELEQAKAQQDAQLQAAKLQAEQQMRAQEAQAKQQIATAELAGKQEMARVDAELQREIAAQKARSEYEIAQLRIAAEQQIAAQRMAAEMDLARWKATEEMKLAREKMRMQAKAAKPNGASDGAMTGGDGIDSYRPGGSLSA
jgi:hypothetical protein